MNMKGLNGTAITVVFYGADGCDILPRLKSWASSPYFMACSSCFSGDRFSKSYIVSTGVNSGLSNRTETGIREAVLESFWRVSESVAIHPTFEKVGFLATRFISLDSSQFASVKMMLHF